MEKRTKDFQRNVKLEELLNEINSDLDMAEKELMKKTYKNYPVVLVMGALRSGTTLTTQWLANTGEFAYPTNLMSRFYNAPIIGAKIQKLLLEPEYNFRNEIMLFSKEISYNSQNGKTVGASSPNEFWYFWRRFFLYETLDEDYLPDSELEKVFDKKGFLSELMGIANVFEKPLVLKGMIANYNIEFINRLLNQVVFIFIKRDPCSNIDSILEARKRQYGDVNHWYSFRIPEKKELQKIKDPAQQIAGQVYYINRAINSALKNISSERKLEMTYEEFCDNPEKFYQLLRGKLQQQGYDISETYCGENKFYLTRTSKSEYVQKAYFKFMKEYLE